MRIAPYTAMFSGGQSLEGDAQIVAWEWDFGDDASADDRSAEGKLVSHRFDQAGSYSVQLTVLDALGGSASTSVDFEVSSFAGSTFYVSSSSGDDQSSGASPAEAWQSLDHALVHMGGTAHAPNRLLLKRGDVWTHSEATTVSVPGPAILDAYGSGDRPRLDFTQIESSSTDAHVGLGSGGSWGRSRIVQNLHIRYTGGPRVSRYLVSGARAGNVLRDCIIENGGIKTSVSKDSPTSFITVEGCEVTGGEKMGWYVQHTDWVLGRDTIFSGAGSSSILDHQLYLNNARNVLHHDCTFDGADGNCNFGTKQHAVLGGALRNCVIRGNRNGSAIGTNYSDTHQPPTTDYVIEGCLYENNGRDNQSSGPYTMRIGEVTIRNCVIRNTPIDPEYGIGSVNISDTDPDTDPLGTVRVYNNTFYSNEMADLHIASGAVLQEIDVRNNLFVRNSVVEQNRQFIQVNGSPPLNSDYNCFFWEGLDASDDTIALSGNYVNTSFLEWQAMGYDTHSIFADPLFLDAAGGDFHLEASSPARDTGQTLPAVPRDRDGAPRRAPTYDMGAYEQ